MSSPSQLLLKPYSMLFILSAEMGGASTFLPRYPNSVRTTPLQLMLQPDRERFASLGVAVVGLGLGPFVEKGSVEAGHGVVDADWRCLIAE